MFNATGQTTSGQCVRAFKVHSSRQTKAPKQQTLMDTFKRKYPQGNVIAKTITEEVTELIALDNQPISMVDELKFLNPRYAL